MSAKFSTVVPSQLLAAFTSAYQGAATAAADDIDWLAREKASAAAFHP